MQKPNPKDPALVTRYLRVAVNRTQRELAEHTGLTLRQITNSEICGKLSVSVAAVLADAYGVSGDVLLNDRFADLISTSIRPQYISADTRHRRRLMQYFDICRLETSAVEFVLRQEQKRLAGSPYAELVNANFTDEADTAMDILSFEPDGTLRRIVVVSSLYETDPLTISSKKYRLLKELPDGTVLYHVFFRPKPQCEILSLNDLSRRRITVSAYRFGGARKEA